MPRRDSLNPEIERELEALDRSLAGDEGDRELAAVVAAVSAERPEPRPDFVRELDARAERGFPREGARAPRSAGPRASLDALGRRLAVPRGMLLPALGAAAALLLALAVVTSQLVDRANQGGDAAPQPAPQTEPAAPADDEGAARGAAPGRESTTTEPVPPTPPGATVPGRGTRRVERSAFLSLSTSPAKLDEVADEVIRVADEQRGVVLSSNVASGSDRGSARFELQVPVERQAAALGALSKLAHVESRTQSANDITGAFVSPRERLTDALAERQTLLRQLAKADTPNETASIRARLRTASREIASARSELRGLRERTSFSRISVSVSSSDADGGGGGGWGLGDAVRDALRVLAVSLGVALVALAVALPFALVLAVLALAGRALRRRRREGALDAV